MTIELSPSLSESAQKLGGYSGFQPPPFTQTVGVVQALSGCGKTSMVCDLKDFAVIDFEGGAHSVPYKRCRRVYYCPVFMAKDLTPNQKARGATAFLDVFEWLKEDARKTQRQFAGVAFDGLTKLQELCIPIMTEEVNEKSKVKKYDDIREYGSGGAGYARLNERCWWYAWELIRLGYGFWATACMTTKVEEFTDRQGIKHTSTWTRPTVSPGVYQLFRDNSDYVLEITTSQANRKGTPVRLFNVHTQQKETQSNAKETNRKARITLPGTIRDVPITGPMAAVEAEYDKAVKSWNEELAKENSR